MSRKIGKTIDEKFSILMTPHFTIVITNLEQYVQLKLLCGPHQLPLLSSALLIE